MGEQRVSLLNRKSDMHSFLKSLLKDIKALEYMLEHDWFESDTIRIGAEQEMVLVHSDSYKPAMVAPQALDMLKKYPWAETELAKFNLEINLDPRVFTNNCLSELEDETTKKLAIIQKKLKKMDTRLLLTGILPTFRKNDLDLNNLTPKKRYKALMQAINRELIGNSYELKILGIDELRIRHSSPMIEACNTSFQVHLQVAPADYVKMYNISQALAAPVMAVAANSPLVFGKRLWHESRIAIFQQALDTRSSHDHLRERSPRVQFGSSWLEDSVLEIYKEDIARFRVLISSDIQEDSLEMIAENKVPKLRALQVHNSTVYRWNRPCYGISDNGKPHLRIENRVLAAGPTVLDEVANAALWLGCMVGMANEIEDIKEHMSFEDAHDNFGKAAKFGIDTKFTWFDDEKITCSDLILKKLIPLAEKGLKSRNVSKKDIDKYLGVIKSRVKKHSTGARWALRSFTNLTKEISTDEALTVITAATLKNQSKKNNPVHKWPLASRKDLKEYKPKDLKVSDFMQTDIFTVRKVDPVEFVAEMMNWKKINNMPVENAKGNLVGLITSRKLLKTLATITSLSQDEEVSVSDVMNTNPDTIGPDESIADALLSMKKSKDKCLLVVQKKELIGIITESQFLKISSRLVERMDG